MINQDRVTINQDRVTALHRSAMEIARKAVDTSSATEARDIYARAYEQEKTAADLLETAFELEPTRSILYRSAAALALRCGKYDEAEDLVAKGLDGNPPGEIADELRNILRQARLESPKDAGNVGWSEKRRWSK